LNLTDILTKLSKGETTVEDALRDISMFSVESIEENLVKIDTGRDIRKFAPEVVLSEGKNPKDIIRIVLTTLTKKDVVLVSRIQRHDFSQVSSALKRKRLKVEVGRRSSTILVTKDHPYRADDSKAKIGILTAGTADIGIAEEARLIAKAMGCKTLLSYDVGIAGIHRLFPMLKEMILQDVDALVVIAGMEGALPSVVSSLVNIPVIAVPTSNGYGFGSNGTAALGTMLQSCTLGMAVVNIDNGIGAGAFAATISLRRNRV
jgi:NCAIR mutase (PurE)-related protein